MTQKDQILDQLDNFLKKEKFSDSEWYKRGLNPSESDLCLRMEDNFNSCTKNLIELIKNDSSNAKLRKALLSGLKSFSTLDYDTEEKEFICTYFDQLSNILNVRIHNHLNAFIYGWFLVAIMGIHEIFKGEKKVKEKTEQECSKCKTKLQTLIYKKDDSVPDYAFYIVRCTTCKEFNLIDPGPGIKEQKHVNFEIVEQLAKSDFNLDQAKIRLEQIKYFRTK
jgi:hypothetical protein